MHRVFAPLLLLPLLLVPGCNRGGGTSAKVPPPVNKDTTDVANLVIAEVGGIQITGADLKDYLVETSGREKQEEYWDVPDVKQISLAGMVDQLVWAEMAKRHGLQLSHEDALKAAAYESRLYANRYVADVLAPQVTPTDEEARAYYQEHQDEFLTPTRLGVRHILVGSQAEAEQILAQARGGADFVQLVHKYSKDEGTRNIGGALGFVEKGKSVPGIGIDQAFEEGTLPLEVGQMAVVQSKMGWHVVLVDRRDPGSLIPYEQSEAALKKSIATKRWGHLYNDALNAAREEVGTRYMTANIQRFYGIDLPGRYYQAASTSTVLSTQLELYRRVAYDFPDYSQSPECLFKLAHLKLTELMDKNAAKKDLDRLHRQYPDSPWRKAGDWLLQNLDEENPKSLGSPEEILAKASGKS